MKKKLLLLLLATTFLVGFDFPKDDSAHKVIQVLEQKRDINNFVEEWSWIYEIEDDYQFWQYYQQMLQAGDGLIDPPEVMSDYYSNEEIQKLYAVVSCEIGDYSFEQQCNVASVIFNRLNSEKFGCNSLTEVLTPSQFATISNGKWRRVKPNQTTIDACNFVFAFGDTADGATYFESGKSNVHGNYAEFVLDDGAHRFYK